MDIGKAALLELDKLGLLDVVKDIARSDKAFRQALSHWADKRADLDFVFDLIDIGMPSGKRLSKFSDQERARIREVTVQMTPAEADAFVALLEQPGKGMDMRGLIGELGLRGAEIQRLTQEARVRR